MGKGDKKSKRGKINIGSFGVSRKRKSRKNAVKNKPVVKKEVPVKVQEPKEIVKEEVKIVAEEAIAENTENAVEAADTDKKSKPKAAKKEGDKKDAPKKKTTKKE